VQLYRVATLFGLILSLISVILPWIEVRGLLGLSVTFYGFTGDGLIVFIVLVLASILLLTKRARWKSGLAVLFSFLGLVLTAVIANNLAQAMRESNVYVQSFYGPGIFLAGIAAITLIISAVLQLRAKNEVSP